MKTYRWKKFGGIAPYYMLDLKDGSDTYITVDSCAGVWGFDVCTMGAVTRAYFGYKTAAEAKRAAIAAYEEWRSSLPFLAHMLRAK